MSWVLEVVGIWFGALAVGLLAVCGVLELYDRLADRQARRQITKHNTYDREYERFRRQAARLGSFATQLEEIQNLPEVHR